MKFYILFVLLISFCWSEKIENAFDVYESFPFKKLSNFIREPYTNFDMEKEIGDFVINKLGYLAMFRIEKLYATRLAAIATYKSKKNDTKTLVKIKIWRKFLPIKFVFDHIQKIVLEFKSKLGFTEKDIDAINGCFKSKSLSDISMVWYGDVLEFIDNGMGDISFVLNRADGIKRVSVFKLSSLTMQKLTELLNLRLIESVNLKL